MNPKDVILKIASLAAIVLAVYIALLGFHQSASLITGIYYLMSAIIILAALVVIFAKVE
ncbi:MAG: hypothetical protein ACP5TZ_03460 [Nitrososphaeria archaeon]